MEKFKFSNDLLQLMTIPMRTNIYPFIDLKVDFAVLGAEFLYFQYEALCNVNVTINDVLAIKCPILATYGDIYQYLCFVEKLKEQIAKGLMTKQQATIELTRYLQTLQYVFESRRVSLGNIWTKEFYLKAMRSYSNFAVREQMYVFRGLQLINPDYKIEMSLQDYPNIKEILFKKFPILDAYTYRQRRPSLYY